MTSIRPSGSINNPADNSTNLRNKKGVHEYGVDISGLRNFGTDLNLPQYGKRIDEEELAEIKRTIISRQIFNADDYKKKHYEFYKQSYERGPEHYKKWLDETLQDEIAEGEKRNKLLFDMYEDDNWENSPMDEKLSFALRDNLKVYKEIKTKLNIIKNEPGINIDEICDYGVDNDIYNILSTRFGYKIDKNELPMLKTFLNEYKNNDNNINEKMRNIKNRCYKFFEIANNDSLDKAREIMDEEQRLNENRNKNCWQKFKAWLKDEDKSCTDGKDDGKIALSKKIDYVLGGFAGGLIKGIVNNPVKTAIGVLAGAGLTALTGGAILPIMWGIGGIASIATIGIGAYKAAGAKTDAEAKKAYENIGGGLFGLLLTTCSYNATMQAAKKAGVNTGYKFSFKTIGSVMKDSAVKSIRNAKSNIRTLSTGVLDAYSNRVRRNTMTTQQIASEEDVRILIPSEDIPNAYKIQYDETPYVQLSDGTKVRFQYTSEFGDGVTPREYLIYDNKTKRFTVDCRMTDLYKDKGGPLKLEINEEANTILKESYINDILSNYKEVHYNTQTEEFFLLSEGGQEIPINPSSRYEMPQVIDAKTGKVKSDLFTSQTIRKDNFINTGCDETIHFRSQTRPCDATTPFTRVKLKDLNYMLKPEGTKFYGRNGIETLQSGNIIIVENGTLSQIPLQTIEPTLPIPVVQRISSVISNFTMPFLQRLFTFSHAA